MTLKDLEFWGPRPYPTTLTDAHGWPLGMIEPTGKINWLPAANHPTYPFGQVVWNGTMTNGIDHTKGRLLADDESRYVDTLTVIAKLVRVRDEDYG